ncbi:hypothetical protein OG292_29475 [Streptomyces sp. NBC_01511]|uniref:hypothetical protein n=1 Tax=Streptomyces sp. NBC_01511 TaxID=2903889 RepID=UPI0038632CDF
MANASAGAIDVYDTHLAARDRESRTPPPPPLQQPLAGAELMNSHREFFWERQVPAWVPSTYAVPTPGILRAVEAALRRMSV